MLELYVSPAGNDGWDGTAPVRRGQSGPLATPEAARNRVRERRRAGSLPAGGVTVWLRGGVYPLEGTFELGREDGGRAGAPVRYRAYRDEQPRLSGGKVLRHAAPVTDPAVLRRLDPAAAPYVRQALLRENGIADAGRLRRRGFGTELVPAPLELFSERGPLRLARWPDEGWLRIAGTPAGEQGGRFTFAGGLPRPWQPSADLWVHGYWTWDWADSYERVVRLDAEHGEVETAPPHGVYGYRTGKRFAFLNVLEQLDTPGEYYVDGEAGIVYFWPPPGAGELTASLLETLLVAVREAADLHLVGLTVEAGRGSGVLLQGGERCVVAGCTLRNLGNQGVQVRGGREHRVQSCDIYDVGDGAIAVSGGDRQTLTGCGHVVENCLLTRFNRWTRTYRPGVQLDGVGIRVAQCRIHDAPHNAILLSGNEHLIEYNEIHDVCRETGDSGAIYMGRNVTMRGHVIRYNSFHDLRAGSLEDGGEGFTEVMAVYLDDCFCGVTVTGNLFRRAGRAVLIGGGRDNVVENNLFVDCQPAIHVDARGKSWASFWFDGRDSTLMEGLRAVPCDRPPYSTRYPGLATILKEDPAFPSGNRVARNISIHGKWAELLDGLTPEQVGMQENLVEGDPGLRDPAAGDYRPVPGGAADRLGFRPLPTERMGLRVDTYRRRLPR